MEKTGPPDLVFQRILANDIPVNVLVNLQSSMFRQTFVLIFQLYNFTQFLIYRSRIDFWHAQEGNFLVNKMILF